MSKVIPIESHLAFRLSKKEKEELKVFFDESEEQVNRELDAAIFQAFQLSEFLRDDLQDLLKAKDRDHETKKNILKVIQPRIEKYGNLLGARV